jgi:ATP-dependent Clp endopeptidase proteolytic subunit ClpP
MNSWYTIRARSSGAEVLIYDEIGAYGVTAKGFLAELGALEEGAEIDLRLNSPGGSVFDAVAIYNALKRHNGAVTVWIDGIAASAASYIAMAGDKVIMPENAFLMIHDPSGVVMGTAEDMRSTAAALDKVKTSLIQGYAAKSGQTEPEIARLMAAETWLDAGEALALGLVDHVSEPVKLVAQFDIGRFRNAPEAVVEAVQEGAGATPEQASEEASAEQDLNTAEQACEPVDTPNTEPEAEPVAETSQTVRGAAIEHARAVIDLCQLAGFPQMAGAFLEVDASIETVRHRLLSLKVEASTTLSSAHAQPGSGSSLSPWGDVIARTFRQKGA